MFNALADRRATTPEFAPGRFQQADRATRHTGHVPSRPPRDAARACEAAARVAEQAQRNVAHATFGGGQDIDSRDLAAVAQPAALRDLSRHEDIDGIAIVRCTRHGRYAGNIRALLTRTAHTMKPPPRLNLVVIRVADLERSADFYRMLGLQFVKHAHGTGPAHYASESAADGLVFELYPATPGQPVSPSTRLGFAVADVDAAVARATQSAGTTLISSPRDSQWGRRAVITDPDGHRVELVARG